MRLDLSTLLLEAINFLVLVWALSRFVYRPLARSIEARRVAQEKARREAEERSEQAARELDDLRRKHAEVAALRERVMHEAAEDAATARARLLAEAREDAAAVRAQGQKLLEAERREAEAAVRDLAIEQSTHIAARLLAELAPRALDDALIDRLAEAVRAHASAVRRDARGVPGVALRFARAPEQDEVDRLRRAFAEALGGEPEIASTEDAALVAGVIATVGDHVFDASIAGNLAVLADRARELAARGEGGAAHG